MLAQVRRQLSGLKRSICRKHFPRSCQTFPDLDCFTGPQVRERAEILYKLLRGECEILPLIYALLSNSKKGENGCILVC